MFNCKMWVGLFRVQISQTGQYDTGVRNNKSSSDSEIDLHHGKWHRDVMSQAEYFIVLSK